MGMSGADVIRRVVNYCPQPKQEQVRAILRDEELLLAIILTVQDAERDGETRGLLRATGQKLVFAS